MRFGVEIEIDAFDGRDFLSSPLRPGELPEGVRQVADLVSGLGKEVQTHEWKNNHNNSVWICKPDSSCGVELCSPVLDETEAFEVLEVMDALKADERVSCGDSCAFHVHVDVSDLVDGIPESSARLCSVLAWWIKSEAVFIDAMPDRRKDSRFCRCIGFTDLFSHDERPVPCLAVNKLRDKYLTLNTHHLVSRKRNSIEFRLLEGTKEASVAMPWINLLINFVRGASSYSIPDDYTWLERNDVLEMFLTRDDALWLRGRIGQNRPANSSRFWIARDLALSDSSGREAFFGQTVPFIDPLEDT